MTRYCFIKNLLYGIDNWHCIPIQQRENFINDSIILEEQYFLDETNGNFRIFKNLKNDFNKKYGKKLPLDICNYSFKHLKEIKD